MRVADIVMGGRYVVREWDAGVAAFNSNVCTVVHDNMPTVIRHSQSLGFPGRWCYWVATVIKKQGQRLIVEWQEPIALHRIPEVPMRWGTRTVRRAVKPSQIVREA